MNLLLTAFSLQLLQTLPHKPAESVFISPLSVRTALELTSQGAKGATLQEMRSALQLSAQPEPQPSPQGYDLRVANALWLARGEKLEKSFVETARTRYASEVEALDFLGATEPSRQHINHWVEEKTEKKIRDLLPSGSLTSDTRLVITNAIYFKADWLKPFDPAQTEKNATFHGADGRKHPVAMMTQTGKLGYTENAQWKVLDLFYRGDQGTQSAAMTILLPKKDLRVSLRKLKAETLQGLLASLSKKRVHAQIPKWKAEFSAELSPALKKLGMKKAFTSAADFSGINGSPGLQIAQVFHKAFVEVDERGTEAAAATAVTMLKSAIDLPDTTVEFRADRPFLYLIRDIPTGQILFLGAFQRP